MAEGAADAVEACDAFFLVRFMRQGRPALRCRKTLDLEACKRVGQALGRCSTLRSLELRAKFQGIGDRGAALLARGIEQSQSLAYLALSGQEIGPDGVSSLCQAFKASKRLTSLSLEVNAIADEGAAQIASVLENTATLQVLNLQRNHIGEKGAEAIARGLESNRSVYYLSLQDNHINDRGAEALSDALRHNVTLEELDLRSCWIGQSGAQALAEALQESNSSLESLVLDDNRLSNKGGESFEQAIAGNRSLLRLGLAYNNIGVRTLAAIDRGLRENARGLHARFARAVHSADPFPWQLGTLLVGGGEQSGKTSLLQSLFRRESTAFEGNREVHAVVSGHGRFSAKANSCKEYASVFAHRVMAGSFSKYAPAVQSENRSAEHEALPMTSCKFSYEKDMMREAKDAESIRLVAWDGCSDPIAHNLLFTQSQLCIIVIDISASTAALKDTLRSWLSSLTVFAPTASAMVVAGKLDLLKGRKRKDKVQEMDEFMRSELRATLPNVVSNSENGLLVFPFSNRTFEGFNDVQNGITETIRKDTSVYGMVSSRWLRCLAVIQSNARSTPYMRVHDLRARLDEEIPGLGLSPAEMQRMLLLFHERGFLVFCTASYALRSLVVLRREWVMHAIDLIIRSPQHLSIHEKASLAEAGLEEDAASLFHRGILSEDLLGFLLNVEEVDYMIDLLQHLMVISSWNVAGTRSGRRFQVPSMLVPARREAEKTTGLIARFKFKVLPLGVFERLVCLLVSMDKGDAGEASTLCRDIARVKLGQENEVIARMLGQESVIQAEFLQEQMAGQNVRMLDTLLRRINDGLTHAKLSWTLLVKEGYEFKPLENEQLKQLRNGPWAIKSHGKDNVDYKPFLDL